MIASLGQSNSHKKQDIQSSAYIITALPFFILRTSHIQVCTQTPQPIHLCSNIFSTGIYSSFVGGLMGYFSKGTGSVQTFVPRLVC